MRFEEPSDIMGEIQEKDTCVRETGRDVTKELRKIGIGID